MKKFALILLMFTLMIGLIPVCAENGIAIRVGSMSVSADEVRKEYETYLHTAQLAGMSMGEEEKAETAYEIVDHFVIRTLAELKLREMDQWELNDNELYEIRDNAQKQYEAMWQYLRDQPGADGLDDAELTQIMEKNGLTVSLLTEELTLNYRLQKLLTLSDNSAEIDDESVLTYYEEYIVAPIRERYEGNVPLFEEEVLMAEDATMVWVPEGYRQLYQIVFPVPDEMQKKLDRILDEAELYTAQAQEAYGKIAALALSGEDITKERETYYSAMEHIDALEVEYGDVWTQVSDVCEKAADEIYARLECGEQFEDLMMNFNCDHVLLYHCDSENWPDTFKAAADSLKQPGDVSSLALCEDGAHMLYYYKDMDSGMLALEGENLEILRNNAASEILYQRLGDLTAPMRDQYEITVDYDSFMN